MWKCDSIKTWHHSKLDRRILQIFSHSFRINFVNDRTAVWSLTNWGCPSHWQIFFHGNCGFFPFVPNSHSLLLSNLHSTLSHFHFYSRVTFCRLTIPFINSSTCSILPAGSFIETMAQNSPYSTLAARTSSKSSSRPSTKASSRGSHRGSSRASTRVNQFQQHAKKPPSTTILLFRLFNLLVMTLLISIAIVVYVVFVFPMRFIRWLLRSRGRQARTKHKLNEKLPVMVHEPPLGENPPRDTVLLIHGFPDSPSVWTDTVSRLNAAGYRCLVVALPGCRGQSVQSMIQFSTVIERLQAAIKSTQTSSSVTVIAHDWGTVFARLLQKSSPQLFHRMVLVDVVDTEEVLRLNLSEALCFWSYVILFAIAYGIGHPFGSYIIQIVVMLAKYDLRPYSELRSDMAWPYATLTLDALRELMRNMCARFDSNSSECLLTDIRSVYGGNSQLPTFYVYGEKKLFMYHSDEWIKYVLASPHGHVERIASDHWIMARKKTVWLSMLLKWLERSNDCVRQWRTESTSVIIIDSSA